MRFDQQPVDDRIRVTAGHWTNAAARTGCTVVLFDQAAPAVVDVRGGAPGSRETSLLGTGDLVQSVDAIALTGGSAFGLSVGDGVMRFLRARDRGVVTPAGPVPIVPVAVLFDLNQGEPIWPDADAGYAACVGAVPLEDLPRGLVGAGTGATSNKLVPGRSPDRGGLGYGDVDVGDGERVQALVAVNSLGAVLTGPEILDPRPSLLAGPSPRSGREATTLAVVMIDAPIDRRTLVRATTAAHDAFARKIVPSHTIFDGDIVFAAALRSGDVPPHRILTYSVAVEIAVERAIIDAVTAGTR